MPKLVWYENKSVWHIFLIKAKNEDKTQKNKSSFGINWSGNYKKKTKSKLHLFLKVKEYAYYQRHFFLKDIKCKRKIKGQALEMC